jgi:hypothetical protein
MWSDTRREAEEQLGDAEPEMLAAAALEGTVEMQVAAARNPRTPTDAAMSLVAHSNLAVLDAVAERADLSPSAAVALVRHGNPVLSGCVARNPACPSELLLRLARSPSHLVAGDALSNPRLPLEAFAAVVVPLIDAFFDPVDGWDADLPTEVSMVLRGAAESTVAPPSVLATLSRLEWLRARVARNPACPDELLGELLVEVLRSGDAELWERAAAQQPDVVVDAVVALNGSWPRLAGSELLELARATVGVAA